MQVTISDAIRYIGVDDKDIDLFESQYVVPEGVSYNSYVILDEKIAVMDTVDARGMEGWEDKLLQTLNGKKPDYLIISHLEPDHAGSIGRMVEIGCAGEDCGQGGRRVIAWNPYIGVLYGTDGTLAGGHGDL